MWIQVSQYSMVCGKPLLLLSLTILILMLTRADVSTVEPDQIPRVLSRSLPHFYCKQGKCNIRQGANE